VTATTISGAISGGNVTLEPGLYWMATLCDTAAVVIQAVSAANNFFAAEVGASSIANLLLAAGFPANQFTLGSQTFASGFTDLTGAGLSGTSTTQAAPIVCFKVASIP
jgi:hypothetical protein